MAQKLTAAKRRALSKEAEDWDHLSDEDLAQLLNEGKPVRIRLRRPPLKTLTVELDALRTSFGRDRFVLYPCPKV